MNRKNIKTAGKRGEVVEKPLREFISEGLTRVTVQYDGTPGPKFTKFGELVSIGQTPNAAKCRCDPTKSECEIDLFVVEKFCSPKK